MAAGQDAAWGAGLGVAEEGGDGELDLHALGAGAAEEAADGVAEEEAAEAEECVLEVREVVQGTGGWQLVKEPALRR